MANVFIQDSTMSAIGDAIRAKTGGTAKILPADMATEIAAIETGSDIQLIEGMEIALDFSDGDQSLSAEDGYAVKSATIKKPTTLVPQNIANGVNIAGVVGTLESGGSSNSGVFISALTNINCGTTTAGVAATHTIKVPSDATNIILWQTALKVRARNSNWEWINENYAQIPAKMFTEEMMTVSDNGDGYKTLKISIPADFAALSGATYYNILQSGDKSFFSYTAPSLTLENNILYAGADCKHIAHYDSYGGRHIPNAYIEGVDLRGSKITQLDTGECSGMPEMKKLWLPETLTYLNMSAIANNTGLEELHFTSTTPPGMWNTGVWHGLPTTCKIYVPAGTLSAYTKASDYPSASTYTYIEE